MMGDAPVLFEEWYAREHPRLVSAMTVIAGNVDTAVDATDEAFARAYEHWERVARMDSPGGWTYRTALNILRRRARRHRLEQRLLRRAHVPVESRPQDWSVELWAALRALPPRERTAAALRYVGDLSNRDVATSMGIAEGTASATLHAARARLAEILGEPADVEVEVLDE